MKRAVNMTFEEGSSKIFMSEARLLQAREGDCLPRDFTCQLPNQLKVIAEVSDTQMILSCLRQIPSHLKTSLFEGYSKLLDLLDIEVQWLALLMGIHYWDPSYRCFTFNDIDLTPTLEEYSHMLGMSLKKQSLVYTYSKNKIAMKHIANLFGVSEQELAKESAEMNGETCIWPLHFVKQCMEKLITSKKWTELRNLIVAAIFGFVLFPAYKNSICHEALDVYFKMTNEGKNPVPAILADTFITLNQCRRSGKGRLKCCYQLLYVWLYCHVMGNGHKGFTSYRITENLLSSFPEKKVSMKLNRQQWLAKFAEVNSGNVYWHIPWTTGCGIVVSCGNFPFVPLFGTKGCISYSPLMVLRQYKMRQFIPPTKRLAEVEFFYKDNLNPELVNLYRQAWHHILIHDVEFCPANKKIEAEYEEWFRNRGKNLLVPEIAHPYFPPLPKETIQNFEVEQELRNKLEQAEDKLLKYEIEVKSLREELAKAKGQLNNGETGEKINDLKKKILVSQRETSCYKRKHEQVMVSLEQCKKQKTEAEDNAKVKILQCEKLKQQLYKAKAQYDHCTEYVEGLQTQNDNLTQSMHELQSQNKALSQQLNELQKQHGSFNYQIDMLTQQLANSHLHEQELNDEVANLNLQIEALIRTIEEVREEKEFRGRVAVHWAREHAFLVNRLSLKAEQLDLQVQAIEIPATHAQLMGLLNHCRALLNDVFSP